jgi:hypothetical protein
MRQRATNHARTNESDFVTRHFGVSFATKIRRAVRGRLAQLQKSHRPKGQKWQMIIFGPGISIV